MLGTRVKGFHNKLIYLHFTWNPSSNQFKEERSVKMSIDQQMEYIRKALELGAHVDVTFYNFRDAEKAEKLASKFSKLAGVPFRQLSNRGSNWFAINTYGDLRTAIFFDEKEEDKEELLCKSN